MDNIVDGSELKIVGTSPVKHDGVDKVTGRAKFGADKHVPGMLIGKILRSPHPHARIKSIDASKALALAGVKAVVTRDDFFELPAPVAQHGNIYTDFRDLMRNCMAREKVLYDGHALAAVAATTAKIAKKALGLIKVEYQVLPHVIDAEDAMLPGAPLLHEKMITEGVDPVPTKPSNVALSEENSMGDVEAGFKQADIIIEREFRTMPVHQGYIEPQACLASMDENGRAELWCSTQGHFAVRAASALMLGMEASKIRVTPSEIGGGFGGKGTSYIEPVALALSRKACAPVKIVLTREEVFRATGPTSGCRTRIKMGATKDGRITAAEADLVYGAGAFRGANLRGAANCMFSAYNLKNARIVAWDVVVNRPKASPYRAPGVPMAVFATEGAVNELADKLGIDRVEMRVINAIHQGNSTIVGLKVGPIGFDEILDKLKNSEHYNAPLKANQGRGISVGFWGNAGGESCASININADGSVTLVEGSVDISGSRMSMSMMVAEELGIDVDKVNSIVGDTSSIGFSMPTVGSRTTFATGMATVRAAREAIRVMCERVAKIWDVSTDEVVWEDGHVKPASSNVGDFEPMSINDIAKIAGRTGGPIAGHSELNAQGPGPGLGAHMADVEVDPETGRVTLLRYTILQDAGRAIHPDSVSGQLQGGATQGVGWALNEEYIYGEDGMLQNPGFLDYRVPVASDMPMIDTIIVEEPNPTHPYGVRGVGETPIIPPQAAVANAVENALGIRINQLPLSPPRILAALEEQKG